MDYEEPRKWDMRGKAVVAAVGPFLGHLLGPQITRLFLARLTKILNLKCPNCAYFRPMTNVIV